MANFPSFGEYVKKRVNYVYLDLTQGSKQYLQEFSKNNGLENFKDYEGNYSAADPSSRYHCTLWYSKTGFAEHGVFYFEPIVAKVSRWQIFGKVDSFLVLELEKNKQIEKLRGLFLSCGFTSDFPTFRPHVTLINHYDRNCVPRIQCPKYVEFNKMVVTESY